MPDWLAILLVQTVRKPGHASSCCLCKCVVLAMRHACCRLWGCGARAQSGSQGTAVDPTPSLYAGCPAAPTRLPPHRPAMPPPTPCCAVHIMLALFWFPPLNTKGIPLPGRTIMDLGARPCWHVALTQHTCAIRCLMGGLPLSVALSCDDQSPGHTQPAISLRPRRCSQHCCHLARHWGDAAGQSSQGWGGLSAAARPRPNQRLTSGDKFALGLSDLCAPLGLPISLPYLHNAISLYSCVSVWL